MLAPDFLTLLLICFIGFGLLCLCATVVIHDIMDDSDIKE